MMASKQEDHYNDPFPSRLRDLVKETKTKNKDLLEVFDVKDPRNVGKYKDGSYSPTPKQIIAVANYYNVSADYLLKLDDPKKHLQEYPLIRKYKRFFNLLLQAEDEIPDEEKSFDLFKHIKEYICFESMKEIVYGDFGMFYIRQNAEDIKAENLPEGKGKPNEPVSLSDEEESELVEDIYHRILLKRIERSLDVLREFYRSKKSASENKQKGANTNDKK